MSEILVDLLRRKESVKLDFKEQVRISTDSEKAELAKDVSAFANTGGGHIVFGVEDNTLRQVGIDPQAFDEARMQQIVSSRCYPPVNFSAQLVLLSELHFGLLTIPNSPLKPHQITQTREIFIRRGSTTDRATRDEIESMIHERRKLEAEVRSIEKIFEGRNWGLRETPEDTRCLSISVCPVSSSVSILTLTRETGEALRRLIPGSLGIFNGYPTQHTYVLESVGRVDSTPRRKIEITRNGLIEFVRVQDIHARFVYLGHVRNYFTLFTHYATSVYREVAPYSGDVYLLVAMNKVEGKQLSTGTWQDHTLESWQRCRQETIRIIRQVTLPIDVEATFEDMSDELKHCFGLE